MEEDRFKGFLSEAVELSHKAQRQEFITFVKKGIEPLSADEKQECLYSLIDSLKRDLTGTPFDSISAPRFQLIEDVIRECLSITPDDTLAWITLAEHFHYYAVDLKRAREIVDTALKKARAEGAFIRQALGVRIRIALALSDYATVESSLRDLVQYKKPAGPVLDVGFEEDFLPRIPPDKVDSALIAQYESLVHGINGVN